MAIKQKTSNPSYFSNLKTSDANFSGGANVNIFNATSKGATSTGIKLGPKAPTREELKKEQNDAIVANNLETAPQINFSQFPDLPTNMREQLMSLVKDKGAERGYLTHITQNSGDTDFIGKSEIASQIGANEDLIMNHIPGQLKKLQAKLEGFNDDAYDDNISSMVDPEKKAFISNLVSGKIPMELDENGNMSFDGKTIDEIESYTNTNYEMGGSMLKSLTSAYDNGVKLSDNELALAKVNFKQSLNKGGTGDLLSTAFDDIMGMGTPLLDKSQYADLIAAIRGDDPAAKMLATKELKLAIEEAYTGKLTEQANAGFDFKQSKKNPTITKTSTIGGVEGYGSEDGNINIDNFYTQFDFGYDAITFNSNGSIASFDLKEHLGNKPETSDLGIYLASSGYNLTSTGKMYSVDGEEMDGETAKAQAISKFTTAEKRKFYNPQATPQEKANILGKYITPGENKYSLGPRKLGTANTKEERNRYTFDVDPNNPETLQAAINKLSKLN